MKKATQFESLLIPNLTVSLLFLLFPTVRSLALSVNDFGATGDGLHYDTLAIQSAIDACHTSAASPCYVTFPRGGTFLTATVFLKSNVILSVQQGAKILGGTKMEDFPPERPRWYVVLAEGATDVGITGGGTIDGQGLKYVERFDETKNVMVSWNTTGACSGKECRPRLVGFLDCVNARVWNITLRQAPYWCLHIVRSQNTAIHDVSIYGDFNSPNTDGIDVEDSYNTVIMRCHIETGDDCICAKTFTRPLQNLTVKDCWVRSKSCALKLGSESLFDMTNIVFDNITVSDSHRGLGLQIRDGGNVSAVTFSNINVTTRYYDPTWWGNAEPIYVTSCRRNWSSNGGSVSDILFVNITAVSENGVLLSGSEDRKLSNVRFVNTNLMFGRWTNYSSGIVDHRPGCGELVSHDAAGMIIEHINGFYVENVRLRWIDERANQWNNPLDFKPSTVNSIFLLNFHSDMYAAQDRIGSFSGGSVNSE